MLKSLISLYLSLTQVQLIHLQNDFLKRYQMRPNQLNCEKISYPLYDVDSAFNFFKGERKNEWIKIQFIHQQGGVRYTAYFNPSLIYFEESYPLSPGNDYTKSFFFNQKQILQTVRMKDPGSTEYPEYSTIFSLRSKNEMNTLKLEVENAKALANYIKKLKICPRRNLD